MNNLEFTASVSVDKGKLRNNNEDNFYLNGRNLTSIDREDSGTYENKADSSEKIHIYGVFDGMGGEEAGEEASIIAAETLKGIHTGLNNNKHYNPKDLITKTVEIANTEICNRMIKDNISRMGTTFSAITIAYGKVIAYNLGDSRIYMMRNGKLNQISVDDTVVKRLIDSGRITKEEARLHKERHTITQHLGIFPDELKLEIHISNEILYKKGDIFLICSDGLTDMVSDEIICQVLSQGQNSEILSQRLVQEALKNGGKDNVTAMVIVSETDAKEKEVDSNIEEELLDQDITQNLEYFVINKSIARKSKKRIIIGLSALLIFCSIIGVSINRHNDTNVIENLEWSTGDNIIDNVVSKDAGNNENFYCKVEFTIENESEDYLCNVTYKSSNPEILDIDDVTGKLTVADVGVATLTATVGESKTIDKEVTVFDITMNTKAINIKKGDTVSIDYEVILPKDCPDDISEEYIKRYSLYMVDEHGGNCININEDKTITAVKRGKTKILVSLLGYKSLIPVNVVR